MEKISVYETVAERHRREEHNNIRREYLDRSSVILSGEVSPHRLLSFLATKYGYSVMGIKTILKKAGIYKDAKHPVVLSGSSAPKQIPIGF